MPPLKPYDRALPYTYAPGAFPAMEAIRCCPGEVERLLIHSQARPELRDSLTQAAQAHGIRVEEADRALSRVSGKENCFAAAVVRKSALPMGAEEPHVVLHHPSDGGNLGTILRSALGFGYRNVALIRPCADPFDPRVIRASMGAMFSLRVVQYDTMEEYRRDHPRHQLYPFMLTGSRSLPQVMDAGVPPLFALVFGNEGSGLPEEFAGMGQPVRIPMTDQVDSLNLAIAAGVGMYAFAQTALNG